MTRFIIPSINVEVEDTIYHFQVLTRRDRGHDLSFQVLTER